ncbi:MAG: cryptochrome/photolyase family protein [Polyangiaceae bacterium]
MKKLRELLDAHRSAPNPSRRWLYVPYDQLSCDIGPLRREAPNSLGVVLIECPAKAARRPYHKQKLAMVLASQRHFALELAQRGFAVRYELARENESYADVLSRVQKQTGPLRMMEAAERELRHELSPLVAKGTLEVIPHEGWLTARTWFEAIGGPPWRMDAFYREARRRTGLLMDHGKPIGGRFSFDGENRKPWSGSPAAPTPPRFEVDEITREVGELILTRFADHPGTLDLGSIPATSADVEALWQWAKTHCLTHFGPFEDAMSTRSTGLFHTRISPLLNLHRLLPTRVVNEVAASNAPIASREGFIRQILGWREFVRHVHVATDGFRDNTRVENEPETHATDGGWSNWQKRAWPSSTPQPVAAQDPSVHRGACPSALGANTEVPSAFWGAPSGLHCLDRVVQDVWTEAWSHHITRLMVLSNLGSLLDLSPRSLTDWFWCAYVDAFDWVVEPNVLAMGTFGTGDLMTTKPYISGSAYIAKMSDYCSGCAFHPKKDCPITPMYWAYLERHEEALSTNERMKLPLNAMRRRPEAQRQADRQVFETTRDALVRGETIKPSRSARKNG